MVYWKFSEKVIDVRVPGTAAPSFGEMNTHKKVTPKSLMDIGVQKLSIEDTCDQFDPYMAYFAQNHKK